MCENLESMIPWFNKEKKEKTKKQLYDDVTLYITSY
jgi:hypothetical protein